MGKMAKWIAAVLILAYSWWLWILFTRQMKHINSLLEGLGPLPVQFP